MTKPILTWVNCYGAWDPEMRSAAEITGYDAYLEGVVNTLSSLSDPLAAIYVSGGMLDEKGRTECATTIPELQQRLLAKGIKVPEVFADEKSVTSITIVKTFLTVWNEQYSECDALLFTDEVRYSTNAFALEYFGKKFQISLPPTSEILIPLPRSDTHPNSTLEKQAEKLQLMKEMGVEEVERREIAARKAA